MLIQRIPHLCNTRRKVDVPSSELERAAYISPNGALRRAFSPRVFFDVCCGRRGGRRAGATGGTRPPRRRETSDARRPESVGDGQAGASAPRRSSWSAVERARPRRRGAPPPPDARSPQRRPPAENDDITRAHGRYGNDVPRGLATIRAPPPGDFFLGWRWETAGAAPASQPPAPLRRAPRRRRCTASGPT